jgi:hypothetical protein
VDVLANVVDLHGAGANDIQESIVRSLERLEVGFHNVGLIMERVDGALHTHLSRYRDSIFMRGMNMVGAPRSPTSANKRR